MSRMVRFDSMEEALKFAGRNQQDNKKCAPVKKTINIPSEHEEQKNLIYWCEIMANEIPELSLIFAIPNGSDRHPVVAAKLQAEGVKSGVPDLFLPVSKRDYHGLFIEMKRSDGGKTTMTQKVWHESLEKEGYKACVCPGFDSAKKAILDYLF